MKSNYIKSLKIILSILTYSNYIVMTIITRQVEARNAHAEKEVISKHDGKDEWCEREDEKRVDRWQRQHWSPLWSMKLMRVESEGVIGEGAIMYSVYDTRDQSELPLQYERPDNNIRLRFNV